MLRLSMLSIKSEKTWTALVIGLVIVETGLVLTALVPAQLWARLFPFSASATLDGPFPPVIAPLITLLLYVLPSVIGWLCQNWKLALLYATVPAWIGLGFFLIAATLKIGTFYLVAPDHVMANVAILELFAVLGGIGWLARNLFRLN
jgi:hypothetical protein